MVITKKEILNKLEDAKRIHAFWRKKVRQYKIYLNAIDDFQKTNRLENPILKKERIDILNDLNRNVKAKEKSSIFKN